MQGEPVHADILGVLDEADALSYEEDACELPDFLNVRKSRYSTGARPATFWYDRRGQN